VVNKTAATVIVVDDDAAIRRALRWQLQTLGFNVLDFHSAEEFLSSEVPSGDVCLLLDVYMPGMSGIELCRKMIGLERCLPTILISGHDDQHTRKMIRAAKPAASLFKPFDEKALVHAIRKALRSSKGSPP
jgi:two-component system, LuxR family, response regulator FixJ